MRSLGTAELPCPAANMRRLLDGLYATPQRIRSRCCRAYGAMLGDWMVDTDTDLSPFRTDRVRRTNQSSRRGRWRAVEAFTLGRAAGPRS